MKHHSWIYPEGTSWNGPVPVERTCRACGLHYFSAAREHFWQFERGGERITVGPLSTDRVPANCSTVASWK